MSYSVCFNCGTMVSMYEKYCDRCARNYRQDPEFWKHSKNYGKDKDTELNLDRIVLSDVQSDATPGFAVPVPVPVPVSGEGTACNVIDHSTGIERRLNRAERRKLERQERRKR